MGIALHILHVGSLNELMITPCTLEPVQWFSHGACGAGIQAAMRSRLGSGRGGGVFPGSSLLQLPYFSGASAPLFLAHVAWFCMRLHMKTSFLCCKAAWLTQQIGHSSVVPCWIYALSLPSHFIVSIISGAHT